MQFSCGSVLERIKVMALSSISGSMSIVFYEIFAKTRFDGNIGDSMLKGAGEQVPYGRLTGQMVHHGKKRLRK